MKTQGRKDVAEAVLIGTLCAVASEIAAWVIGDVFRRRDERKKREKEERKKRRSRK